MKFRISILLFLFIFAFSLSSAVSMACCWNMESDMQDTGHLMTQDMGEDCHSAVDTQNTDSKKNNNDEAETDCCYNMIECKVQVIKIANNISVNADSFEINYRSANDKFISNTVEPLKHPLKALL